MQKSIWCFEYLALHLPLLVSSLVSSTSDIFFYNNVFAGNAPFDLKHRMQNCFLCLADTCWLLCCSAFMCCGNLHLPSFPSHYGLPSVYDCWHVEVQRDQASVRCPMLYTSIWEHHTDTAKPADIICLGLFIYLFSQKSVHGMCTTLNARIRKRIEVLSKKI